MGGGGWGGNFLTSYPNSFFRTYIYIASTPAKTPHLSTYLSCLSASLRRNFNKAYSNRDTSREDKSR